MGIASSDSETSPEAEVLFGSEIPFPPKLSVGSGTPLLVGGWCYSTYDSNRIRSLEIAVDGFTSNAISSGLPRKDVYREAKQGPTGKAPRGAFESGFLAVAQVPASAAGRTVAVELIATTRKGSTIRRQIGELTLSPDPIPGDEVEWPEADTGGPRVAICMATFSPRPLQLQRQIDSLREQTHRNWVCFISDDQGTQESRDVIERAIGGDPRFVVSQAPNRLGFYANFERALEMVPSSAELIALADQDDRWDSDKLEVLIEAVSDEGVGMAFCDSRIVSETGELIHPSYWALGRHNNYSNLASLMIANTVTGAASIFTPDVLRLALPFPHTPVNVFHDHWIACVALAAGRIAYVDRPLYDYIQHDDAVIGFEVAMSAVGKPRAQPLRSLLSAARDIWRSKGSSPSELVSGRQMPLTYFFGSSRAIVLAASVRMRCGNLITRRKRRQVSRLETVDSRTSSFLWLLLRRMRRFIGWNETGDIERHIAKGLLWRRLVQTRGRLERNPDHIAADARVPMLAEAEPGEAFRL